MKHILFDLDGTVADTERLKAKAISRAVSHFGGEVTDELYKKWMGQSWETVTAAFFKEAQVSVELKDFDPIFKEYYLKLIDEELHEHNSFSTFAKFLKSRGFRFALVSSGVPWMIQKTLERLRLENTFEVIVSAEDVVNHKPDPEPYEKALSKLGADASEAVAFEDSESGFRSAHAAGVKVFGVKHSFNGSHSFDLCAGTFRSFDECMEWEIFK